MNGCLTPLVSMWEKPHAAETITVTNPTSNAEAPVRRALDCGSCGVVGTTVVTDTADTPIVPVETVEMFGTACTAANACEESVDAEVVTEELKAAAVVPAGGVIVTSARTEPADNWTCTSASVIC